MEVLKWHDWGVILKLHSTVDEEDKGNAEYDFP